MNPLGCHGFSSFPLCLYVIVHSISFHLLYDHVVMFYDSVMDLKCFMMTGGREIVPHVHLGNELQWYVDQCSYYDSSTLRLGVY